MKDDDFTLPPPQPFLPVRDGTPQGSSVERRMLARAGGPTGHRTVIQNNADGSTTTLRTRGGRPEFTTYGGEKETEEHAKRTFVFRVYDEAASATTALDAIVANRDGRSAKMKFARRIKVWKDAIWAVLSKKSVASPFKTIGSGRKWFDVVRIEHKQLMINGVVDGEKAAPQVMEELSKTYGRWAIPYVVRVNGDYEPAPVHDPNNSLVFLGGQVLTDGHYGVVNLLRNGEDGDFEEASFYADPHVPDYMSGDTVRDTPGVEGQGEFLFRGSWLDFHTYDHQILDQYVSWCRIKVTAEPPYMTKESGTQQIGGWRPFFEPPTTTIPEPTITESTESLPDDYTRFIHTAEVEFTDFRADMPYAWAGTDIEMTLNAAVEFGGTYRYEWYGNIGGGTITETGTNTTSTTLKLEIKDFAVLLDYASEYMHSGQLYYGRPPLGGTMYGRTVAITKDYIYCDRDEEVYLTFEGTVTAQFDTHGNAPGLVEAKYVLSVRGEEHTFNVTVGSLYSGLVADSGGGTASTQSFFLRQRDAVDSVAYNYGFWYDTAFKPAPDFNPLFCSQSACPFIAYTTKAEEAAGAIPEFYLDMRLIPRRYTSIGDKGTKTPALTFIPTQFNRVFYHLICGLNTYSPGTLPTSYELTLNGRFVSDGKAYDPWEDFMFVEGTRIQFSNGIVGPWAHKLGAKFTDENKFTDISRI